MYSNAPYNCAINVQFVELQASTETHPFLHETCILVPANEHGYFVAS
jgi:hypothetical protein